VLAGIAITTALTGCETQPLATPTIHASPDDWRSDWAVRRGYSVSRDASGFTLPTAIAFVPTPGKGPKDPLYFVAELHGAVKVVTNDRTVLTFAQDFFRLDSVEAYGIFPSLELGMGGICLDPTSGYVFVTFIYHDGKKILRNNIARFSTAPGTFATVPNATRLFSDVLSGYPSGISHQIGQCQVSGGRLFVGIGDGNLSSQSQSLGSPLGKILRMTLDGAPAIGNPFYRNANRNTITNYIWAYGLRNPFGLRAIGDRLMASDNGVDIDRLVDVRRGHNYLWDGNDRSIATNAFLLLVPGRGVAHMDIVDHNESIAGSGDHLQIMQVVSGDTEQLSEERRPQIMEIGYSLATRTATSVPRTLLRYQGNTLQTLIGVAKGPDGLYFTAMFPDRSDSTFVYRIAFSPEQEYPFLLENNQAPAVLIREYGCLGCHSLYGSASGRRGPVLDRDSLISGLRARLENDRYRRAMALLDTSTTEPFVSTRPWRAEVAAAVGRAKLRTWVEFHVREPKFDNPNAQMPNLAVSADHAADIAEYLIGRDSIPLSLSNPQVELGIDPEGRKPLSGVAIALIAIIAGAMITGIVLRRSWR
jgi:hypothetical protein